MQWHSMELSEIRKELNSSQKGLSQKEAEERKQKFGENILTHKPPKSFGKKILEQLSDFMVLVLIAAAVLSFATSLLQGESDIIDPVIILLIVVLNAVMGIVQESKAEKAIEALQKLSSPHVKVFRDGQLTVLETKELVPGDVISLEAGDYVPSDARILESSDLLAEESALTGESLPVEKDGKKKIAENAPPSERKNTVLAGTLIVSGRCKALVTDTGMKTEVGRIASLLNSHENPQTPLQKRLESTGKFLGIAALLICGGIFVMGLIQKVLPLDMFMISVSLAVAAIPEGLPAIVTIVLAMGVQRMARSNAIIRKLPAVETLGSATVICSDKTGTLTQNKMTVTTAAGKTTMPLSSDFSKKLLFYGCLCNNSSGETAGNPTETAIVTAAQNQGIRIDKRLERIKEFPFDSNRKRMTTVHRKGSGYLIVTKGAPELLLQRCTKIDDGESVQQLTPSLLSDILRRNENMMAGQALRVIAVAYKEESDSNAYGNLDKAESGLTFLGLIGMMDPPREEVFEAVATCKKAGIRAVMITGDHKTTAAAIASKLGIYNSGDTVLTGEELDKLSDRQLRQHVSKCTVFARVTPQHKVKIVKAYQSNGEVVAMTGDGVNDAPALKAADIGCAMGITGTEVAKGAADMILLDDNFSSIVEAVKEGRGIYQNIKKSVHFLLSSNIGEIITVFVAFLLGLPAILLPIQLLFVNLITDSLPALSLGVDKIEKDIMERPPVPSSQSLFSGGLWLKIALEGLLIGFLALIAFQIGSTQFDNFGSDPVIGRTMAFSVLCLSQLVHAFNSRSKRSLLKIGLFSNPYLVLSFLLCFSMLAVVVAVPFAAAVFKVTPLSLLQWGLVLLLGFIPLAAVEFCKISRASIRIFREKISIPKSL